MRFGCSQSIITRCVIKVLAGKVLVRLAYAHVRRSLRHVKTCLMSFANNKGADQSGHPRSLLFLALIARYLLPTQEIQCCSLFL